MKRFVRASALAAALFCSTALVNPAQAQRGASAEDAFFQSRYTYCDAKLLGDLWGTDAYEGKITIGSKIINRIEENLEPLLADSRRRGNRCEWIDTGYSYQDAERLGRYWGNQTYDAKLRAADLLTRGRGFSVDRDLILAYNSRY